MSPSSILSYLNPTKQQNEYPCHFHTSDLIVLVNSFKPANIIMTVSNNVDIEHVLHPRHAGGVPTLATGEVDQKTGEEGDDQKEIHHQL